MNMPNYVMVTNFENHWDQIPNNTTKYSVSMIKFGNKSLTEVADIDEKLPVIFIKRKKNGPVEKAWRGNIKALCKKSYKESYQIYFNVNIDKEILCPLEFMNLLEGWYLKDINQTLDIVETAQEQINIYNPPFFKSFISGTWEDFEDNTYRLLRLIGIHNIHPYDKKKQKGNPDGLFKLRNTIVLYDCTLESNYSESKSTQIDNYCSQLRSNKLAFGIQEYEIKECNKYVWIITRNNITKIIKKYDDMEVKEIPIQKLIEIYSLRLKNHDIDEKDLEK